MAAQQGDAEAFAALARMSADRLFAVAVRITRDRQRAEDALQEALMSIWKELPRLRDADRFDAWSYRVIVRSAIREAQAVQSSLPPLYVVPHEPASPANLVNDVVRRDRLDRGFRRLPPDQRAVLVLHFYAGLSLAEIASTLGLRIGTVGSRLHYGKRSLRAALEADDRTVEQTA